MNRWIAKGKLYIEKPSGRREFIVYSSLPFYTVDFEGPDEKRCINEIKKSFSDELEETGSDDKLLYVYFIEVESSLR